VKQLFETIKIENNQIHNLIWHNQRLNQSRLVLFGEQHPLDLKEFIKLPKKKGLYRCRVLYDTTIRKVEYIPYQPKSVQRLKIVSSQLDYAHKFDDRLELNALSLPSYDDIIIEKNGLLTDTTIANIAFYDGQSWLTPSTPLLQGTTRERLLSDGFLTRKEIKKEDIKNYSHFALMNAMIGFQVDKSITITP